MEFDFNHLHSELQQPQKEQAESSEIDSICARIQDGSMDDAIERIRDAIRDRNAALDDLRAYIAETSIKVGDKVKLVNVSPSKAEGTICTVTKRVGRKIYVKLPYTISSRLRAHQEINWPSKCYVKVREVAHETDYSS